MRVLLTVRREAALSVGALAVGLATISDDAEACMCIREPIRMLTPRGQDDAPLNTRVRFNITLHWLNPAEGHRFVLRESATGVEVPTTMRGPFPPRAGAGTEGIVELLPKASTLAPATRYEVALIKPKEHPSTTVFGTFRTGNLVDKTAPAMDPITKFQVGGVSHQLPSGVIVVSSCGGDTPHVMIDRVASRDPARPNAQLLYAVWLGDSTTGRIDSTKPPTGIFEARDGSLTIGAANLCQMDFPFPQNVPFVWLGVSAVDEAGNASAPQMLKVVLSHP